MEILHQYQEASGQKVNLDKSEIFFFSLNNSHDFKRKFQDHLSVKITDNIHKYLRIPTKFERSKEQDFHFIMDGRRKSYLLKGGRGEGGGGGPN